MGNFDGVIGYESIKAELVKFADVIKNNGKYSRLGVSIPSGIILYGPPGVGKTLMAKSFIAEAGCKVFTIRKDRPNGEFVKHIKDTFDEAKESSPAIVFLDDMDKFANEDEEHKNAEEYIAVQSGIDDCKGKGVFTLATVNDMRCLPDSLMRCGRFDKNIEVDSPRGKDGMEIIKHYLDQKRISENVDIEELALIMEGNSCAVIEAVINDAGVYAGFNNKEFIEQDDLIKAFLRMRFDVPEKMSRENRANIRSVAIHEAGHAVVAEVLDPGSVALASVQVRDLLFSEGVVITHKSDDYYYSKTPQEHEVMIALGGKAATEVVLGAADMGSVHDIEKALGMINTFIDCDFTTGFSAFVRSNTTSEMMRSSLDRQIATDAERYYQETKRIIVEHRNFYEAVLNALLENETITYRDMQRMRKEYF